MWCEESVGVVKPSGLTSNHWPAALFKMQTRYYSRSLSKFLLTVDITVICIQFSSCFLMFVYYNNCNNCWVVSLYSIRRFHGVHHNILRWIRPDPICQSLGSVQIVKSFMMVRPNLLGYYFSYFRKACDKVPNNSCFINIMEKLELNKQSY